MRFSCTLRLFFLRDMTTPTAVYGAILGGRFGHHHLEKQEIKRWFRERKAAGIRTTDAEFPNRQRVGRRYHVHGPADAQCPAFFRPVPEQRKSVMGPSSSKTAKRPAICTGVRRGEL